MVSAPAVASIATDDVLPLDEDGDDSPDSPNNSYSPARVGFDETDGVAIMMTTMKTNNASIKHVRRNDDAFKSRMRK